MELVSSPLVNASVRRESLHGRSYLVAPTTLLVPGVLNGSMGPLYYPPEDTALGADSWNGMPIVVYHPRKDGRNVSARSPSVMVESAVGTVYNVEFNGKLTAESWFDEELVRKADKNLPPSAAMLPRLLRGEPIEVSTGLFTENEKALPGASHNGQPYTHIARRHRPDHLAVLPDVPGACSVRDGCGVLVNASDQCGDDCDCTPCKHKQAMKSHGDPVMNTPAHTEAIAFLVANCDCWKGEEGQKALNSLPESVVLKLKADAEKLKTPVVNAPVVPAPVVNACTEPDDDDEEGVLTGSKKKKKGMAMNEWMALAPPEAQLALNTALEIARAEKQKLIDSLTANVADAQKAALVAQLETNNVPQLRNLLLLKGTAAPVANTVSALPELDGILPTIYTPATAGAPVGNKSGEIEEEGLPILAINWKSA